MFNDLQLNMKCFCDDVIYMVVQVFI